MHKNSSKPSNKRPWHQHFETVGSITAIVVGVAALLVSWDQGRVMREEIRASLWPALQVDGYASRSDEQLSLGLRIENAGVGPALVKRISVSYKGELLPDFEAIKSRMPPNGDASMQTMQGRILAAGAVVEPFEFRYAAGDEMDAVEIHGALADVWEIEVCYCSSLAQCWTTSTVTQSPQEVSSCGTAPGSDL